MKLIQIVMVKKFKIFFILFILKYHYNFFLYERGFWLITIIKYYILTGVGGRKNKFRNLVTEKGEACFKVEKQIADMARARRNQSG